MSICHLFSVHVPRAELPLSVDDHFAPGNDPQSLGTDVWDPLQGFLAPFYPQMDTCFLSGQCVTQLCLDGALSAPGPGADGLNQAPGNLRLEMFSLGTMEALISSNSTVTWEVTAPLMLLLIFQCSILKARNVKYLCVKCVLCACFKIR